MNQFKICDVIDQKNLNICSTCVYNDAIATYKHKDKYVASNELFVK